MDDHHAVSRRKFMGGVAATIGYAGLGPDVASWAQGRGGRGGAGADQAARAPRSIEDYDSLAKLANNENPYGPPESVMKAMTNAFKYSNRYGYPDGGIRQAIAEHHGVKPENVILTAGSGELLDVVGSTFGQNGKKVVGVEPSYSQVYQHVTRVKGEAITLPLTKDYRQDMAAIIKAAKTHYRDVGFVYLCNPNNPTGMIVTKDEVKQLLDGLPEDMPVLIDEAYHHFIDDPRYATSIPYVLEGRPVIVARTFSKIAALAGMRLGYGVAPRELVDRMGPWATGTINAIVKWGGVAALKDTESQARVKRVTTELRNKTTKELESLGYQCIPSQTNFFMVHIKRQVVPVIEEFRKKGVLVGRPFPPMTEHLRVSIGTPEEMDRFMVAFKDIFATTKTTAQGAA